MEWHDEKSLELTVLELLEVSFSRARDVPSSDLHPTPILIILNEMTIPQINKFHMCLSLFFFSF